jgi:branched-subunit amino acid transport protein
VSVIETVVVLGVIAVGTYLARALPILMLAGRVLPLPMQLALRNVGPAVMAALVVVSVSTSSAAPGIQVVEVVALVVAGIVARWRRNLIWATAAGLMALWIGIWLQ